MVPRSPPTACPIPSSACAAITCLPFKRAVPGHANIYLDCYSDYCYDFPFRISY